MRHLFLALLILASTSSALADEEHPAIAGARQQLATYDLEGSRTTAVLVELGRFDRTAYLHEIRRARFLRAAAAADLLLLAHLKNLPQLTRRVAEAYEVAPERIVRHVRSELAAVRVGVYAPIVDDAAAALDRMTGVRGDRAEGPRSDAFFVHDVLAAAEANDPVAALAPLSRAEAELPFDRSGRRAAAAVVEALQAVERLREAASHGDPFAAQLEELGQRRQDLRAIVLTPLPAADEALGLGAVDRGAPIRPDLVLSVHPTEVRYAFVPRVSFATGAPALVSDQTPAFPAIGSVPLERLPRWPRPVDALVEALAPLIDGDTAVAIGGAPNAEAHLLTRAWQSVARAGVEPKWLVARSRAGLLAGVPAAAARDAAEPTEIFVRLGGHSVAQRGAPSTSIPRQRSGDSWRHDFEQLAGAVQGPAALRYMASVPLQTLTQTAFVVGERVTLDFP